MVDSRGRLTLTLKPSHQQKLKKIQAVSDADESEVCLDALNYYYRSMIQTGEIQVSVDSDVAVRLARKIAVMLGNTGEDLEYLDEVTSISTDGKSTVNVRMT